MPDAEFTLAEMTTWGETLGTNVVAPAVITLTGDLGAGKTTLAQAICRGYGVAEPVTSPTFALVHEYRAPRSPVLHLDLYRLAGAHELANIGWEDALASRSLVLVEWPERAGPEVPRDATVIRIDYLADRPERRRVSW